MEICGLSVGGNLDAGISFCSNLIHTSPKNTHSQPLQAQRTFMSKLIDARPGQTSSSFGEEAENFEHRIIFKKWRMSEHLLPSNTYSQSSSSSSSSRLKAKVKNPSRRTRGVQIVRASTSMLEKYADEQDFLKAGGDELPFVQMQAYKTMEQPKIADKLPVLQIGSGVLDLAVIGCGPAGLSLAAEAARMGLNVGLLGPDMPFVNNYGVWEDEFAALGLEDCIEHTWPDTAMYFENDKPLLLGRAYGRVGRSKLRQELLNRCADAGVKYLNSEVERIVDANENNSFVICQNGRNVHSRLVTVASGAAAGKFLKYEEGGPGVTVQTAYGVEVEVEQSPYDPDIMVFMDYRDYGEMGERKVVSEKTPTFLYVMPLSPTRVFFEETCLAARPALPFKELKERLQLRMKSLGVKVVHVYEEEWSYIPVGGTLPDTTQRHLGFGAAASVVHPATGYSVVRSLSEAPSYAAAIAAALKSETSHRFKEPALEAWNVLWPRERKRQRAFFLFGLELLLQLDNTGMRTFFRTFFDLPEWMWKGFLASKLSSAELIWFALVTFVVAPGSLRLQLIKHLMDDPSGANMLRVYAGL